MSISEISGWRRTVGKILNTGYGWIKWGTELCGKTRDALTGGACLIGQAEAILSANGFSFTGKLGE